MVLGKRNDSSRFKLDTFKALIRFFRQYLRTENLLTGEITTALDRAVSEVSVFSATNNLDEKKINACCPEDLEIILAAIPCSDPLKDFWCSLYSHVLSTGCRSVTLVNICYEDIEKIHFENDFVYITFKYRYGKGFPGNWNHLVTLIILHLFIEVIIIISINCLTIIIRSQLEVKSKNL